MAKISLKNIIGKKNETTGVVSTLIDALNVAVWVEDENGKVLSGHPLDISYSSYPITTDNETIGYVKGDEKGSVVANLISQLAQKESEKKKLGAEVLNLYQEINIIFNFSEQLSQTIEPEAIAKITLQQAMHSIPAHSGIIVLWDDADKSLFVPAAEGEPMFNNEKLIANTSLLLKMGLTGNSEIIVDMTQLKERGIVNDEAQSLAYAARKV